MRNTIKIIILVAFSCMLVLPVYGQGNTLEEFLYPTLSRNNRMIYDIWISGDYSKVRHVNFWTANNNVFSDNYPLYDTWFNLRLDADLYWSKNKYLPLIRVSMGYQNEWYTYDNGHTDNSGLCSHWLSVDCNLRHSYLLVGMRGNIFLASNVVSNDQYSYMGINSDCFNSVAYSFYVGGFVRFTYIDLHAAIGSWIKTEMNPSKLAYFNLTKTYINGLFWEVGLAIRLFSSGISLTSPSLFKND